jgi:N-acetyltransferase 10
VNCQVLQPYISPFDLKRLEAYTQNLVDFHLIMDLVPTIAKLYFSILPQGSFTLSPVQAAILTGIGLQYKNVEDLQ